ncbi:XdhC and CoxI family protein [Planctomycetes bacterium MalM25]|nr:XdhC and CoxI family protein [Planctomycetes bacterium MalM25]
MTDAALYRRSAELAESATPFVTVTLVETTGSTPADAGAKMLVIASGLELGTVGGGRVEAKALGLAAEMLAGGPTTRLVDWSLKADVGMTCGGRVKLLLESVGVAPWPIVIFGAGHVTQALARLLVTLPCQVTCIDPRREWLDKLPAGVRALESDDPPAEVEQLPGDAFVLCMTKGHRSDLPVLRAIFESGIVFPYLGVIGSRAKAAVLRKELTEAGVAEERLAFHCPIGLPIGSNSPGEIAVSIAAQLLEQRDVTSRAGSAAT